MAGVVEDIGPQVVAGLGQWGALEVIQIHGDQEATLEVEAALVEVAQATHGKNNDAGSLG